MSYGTPARITALSPAIGDITTTTNPTTQAAEDWLEEGYAAINQALAGAGYVVPVVLDAAVMPVLRSLNVLYATAYALRARGLDVVEGKEETRSEIYLREFWARLKLLVATDLTVVGVPVTPVSLTGPARRRGLRTLQLRRIDGYSANAGVDGASE